MNLESQYLGLTLKNPLIVSACPLSKELDNIRAMAKAGASAIVMYSIFEEEIRYDDAFVDHFLLRGTESFAEALTYFPSTKRRHSFLNQHLHHLEQSVKTVPIPIIGSLNAITQEGWIEYAEKMQQTGIQALELNLYFLPHRFQSSIEIEQSYLEIVQMVKNRIKIPLAVKLSPFFTSLPDIVLKLDREIQVDGLVLFNRFYHPDFDIDTLEFLTALQLSSPYEIRLPLRWIAKLYDQVHTSLCGSTGVDQSDEVIKYILAGADTVMCASCLMKYGIEHLTHILQGLEKWLQEKNYTAIEQIQGLMSQAHVSHPQEFERAHYMKALKSFTRKINTLE